MASFESQLQSEECASKIKIFMVGDSGVGKTCVLVRFADDTFREMFISIIGIDFKIKTFEIDGKRVRLQIWDTDGMGRFQNIVRSYYKGTDGFMLVFDITNEKSFENIKQWLETIDMDIPSDKHVEKLLVGNKCDLESERVVPYERIQEMAEAQNINYIETSAKTSHNIDEAFGMLVNQILKKTSNKEETEPEDNILQLQGQEQQQVEDSNNNN